MHVESKQKSIILIKSVYCLNAVERIPQGPCSTIYYTIYLLSMFAKFLVHVCAVTSGIGLDGRKCRGLWPLCITNIHHTALKPTMKITCTRNTFMQHSTPDTAEQSDVYMSLHHQSQEALNAWLIYSQFKRCTKYLLALRDVTNRLGDSTATVTDFPWSQCCGIQKCTSSFCITNQIKHTM